MFTTPHPHDHAGGHAPTTASRPCDGGHCHGEALDLARAGVAFRRALIAVIVINATLFVVEIAAGALADSRALQADALDFLGDTLTYGLSFAVLGMSLARRAMAALLKGVALAAMGLWVLGSTLYQALGPGLPDAPMMGMVGVLALAANLASVVILSRFRDGDANIRSVWLCSRNDAIGNVAVLGAAGAVALTGTAWPDLLVAALMAMLFLSSAREILIRAIGELRVARLHP